MKDYKPFSKEEVRVFRDAVAIDIEDNHPEVMSNGEVSSFKVSHDLRKAPFSFLEWYLWDRLDRGAHWDSLTSLNILNERNNGYYFELDTNKRLVQTIFDMRMSEEGSALCVPRPACVLAELANREKSCLADLVTEDHKMQAVNIGFWNLLSYCIDSPLNDKTRLDYDQNTIQQDSASRELKELLNLRDFFDLFSFREGVRYARLIPEDLRFDGGMDLWRYMKWLNVQVESLYKDLDYGEATDVFGRLAAPLVRDLLTSGDFNEREELLRLAGFFLNDEDLIRTGPIQRMVGRLYELKLAGSFNPWAEEDEDKFKVAKRLEGVLVDIGDLREFAWKIASKRRKVEIDKLPFKDLLDYVPKSEIQDHVDSVRGQVERMQRFDVDLFGKWVRDFSVARIVSSSEIGRIRNNALEVYFNQGARPKEEDVRRLYGFVGGGKFGSNYLGDKVRGHLLMDFLFRKNWSCANEILGIYNFNGRTEEDRSGFEGRRLEVFRNSFKDYVSKHGKKEVDENGLRKDACYPHYNNIPDFVSRNL